MGSADPPVLFHRKMLLEPVQEIIRRHNAAGEEIEAYLVVGTPGHLKIGHPVVGEDMDEKLAPGLEPAPDPLEQQPVPHVLEHLYENHQVESARRVEAVHVGLFN